MDRVNIAELWLERAVQDERTAFLLAGPTASGKSALAIALHEAAKAHGIKTIVVNADSMQVYGELRVITARPSDTDFETAPHHLFGHVSAREAYSVAQWLDDVGKLLAAHEDAWPIFVGGTGLYFNALTEGLAPIPEIDPHIRAKWRYMGDTSPVGAVHQELTRIDPKAARRLRPSDTQRVVRALEVMESTGRSIIDWQGAPNAPPLLPLDRVDAMVLSTSTDGLNTRIYRRLEAMLESGAVDEAVNVMALPLSPDAPALKAIGVREFAALGRGEISKEDALDAASLATRRYAKRQRTWFRQRMKEWTWQEA